jgi:hypothetical protein
MSDDVRVPVPCGRFYYPVRRHCAGSFLCPNCTELLTLRRRVAELEATAARDPGDVICRNCAKPVAGKDFCHCAEEYLAEHRTAAAEVAAGET